MFKPAKTMFAPPPVFDEDQAESATPDACTRIAMNPMDELNRLEELQARAMAEQPKRVAPKKRFAVGSGQLDSVPGEFPGAAFDGPVTEPSIDGQREHSIESAWDDAGDWGTPMNPQHANERLSQSEAVARARQRQDSFDAEGLARALAETRAAEEAANREAMMAYDAYASGAALSVESMDEEFSNAGGYQPVAPAYAPSSRPMQVDHEAHCDSTPAPMQLPNAPGQAHVLSPAEGPAPVQLAPESFSPHTPAGMAAPYGPGSGPLPAPPARRPQASTPPQEDGGEYYAGFSNPAPAPVPSTEVPWFVQEGATPAPPKVAGRRGKRGKRVERVSDKFPQGGNIVQTMMIIPAEEAAAMAANAIAELDEESSRADTADIERQEKARGLRGWLGGVKKRVKKRR